MDIVAVDNVPIDHDERRKEYHARCEIFAYRYLETGHNKEAAAKALYPTVDDEAKLTVIANAMLKIAYVMELISKVSLQRQEDFKKNSQQVLNDLQTLKEMCFDAGDLKTAAKTIELQAKHLGLLQDKHNITTTLTLSDLVKAHE